jgi:hypothetical protein
MTRALNPMNNHDRDEHDPKPTLAIVMYHEADPVPANENQPSKSAWLMLRAPGTSCSTQE